MATAEPTRNATIFDVARLAGVSHQTVSRVLNGATNVRPETKNRVEKAIAQLRYSPSPAARALVTRRTRSIGLITPSLTDFGPTSIAMHFTIAAREARYSVNSVSASPTDPAAVRQAVEALLRQRVDALVIIAVDVAVVELLQAIDVGVPIVIATSSPTRSARIASIDQARGARAAVRHLAELGHTRILHVTGPQSAPDSIERVRGWREELAAQRLETIDPLNGDWSAATGYRIGMDIEIDGPTAVFVSNDLTAMGLMSALRQRRLSVPRDVSIVGFDDIPEAAFFHPALTTVRQDFAALGQLVMQKILVQVEEPDAHIADAPLASRLIERASTRAVVTVA